MARRRQPLMGASMPRLSDRVARPNGSQAGWLSSVRGPSTSRINLDGRSQAGNQTNAIGNLIDFDADRHALSEPDPSEDRVDVRHPLVIGVRIGDVDRPGDAADLASDDLAM